VTAPVFVVDGAALQEAAPCSVVTVNGPEGRHAVTVRRIRIGEAVAVVDGLGRRAVGEVLSISGKDTLQFAVYSVDVEPLPQPRVTVVQALPKGDRGELAVELLTEVGVDVVVPWSAANCMTQWRPERAERAWQKWHDTSVAAAKQSRRSRFPIVRTLAATTEVASLLASADLAVVLHEDARRPIASVDVPEAGDVVVVVGPEGGLTQDELVAFEGAGAVCVRLGPTVLRTSSAGMAAVAAMLAGSRRWSVSSEPNVALDGSVEG